MFWCSDFRLAGHFDRSHREDLRTQRPQGSPALLVRLPTLLYRRLPWSPSNVSRPIVVNAHAPGDDSLSRCGWLVEARTERTVRATAGNVPLLTRPRLQTPPPGLPPGNNRVQAELVVTTPDAAPPRVAELGQTILRRSRIHHRSGVTAHLRKETMEAPIGCQLGMEGRRQHGSLTHQHGRGRHLTIAFSVVPIALDGRQHLDLAPGARSTRGARMNTAGNGSPPSTSPTVNSLSKLCS